MEYYNYIKNIKPDRIGNMKNGKYVCIIYNEEKIIEYKEYIKKIKEYTNNIIRIDENLEKMEIKIQQSKIVVIFDKIKNYEKIIKCCNNNFIPYIEISNFDKIEIILDYYYKNKIDIKFSIIIPSYNNEKYIQLAIKSIFTQTFSEYNIIIIDDNSIDDSINKIKEMRKSNIYIYQNEKNEGKYVSINKILEKSSEILNDYIIILDSDDILMPNRLLYDYYYIIKNNRKVIQTKYIRFKIKTGRIITKETYGDNIVSINKRIFSEIGSYYENRYGGDSEMLERIRIKYGEEEIERVDYISYVSILKEDGSNLTKIYKKDERIGFIKYYKELHEKIGSDMGNFYMKKKYKNIDIRNDLDRIFLFYKMGIRQVYISEKLDKFRERFMNFYLLEDYKNKDEELLVFGYYDNKDLEIIKNHKSIIYLLWGGTDIDIRYNFREIFIKNIINKKNIIHLAMSNSISKRLNILNIQHKLIYVNFTNKAIFNSDNNNNSNNNIFIYNGGINSDKYIYNETLYKKIIEKLPQYNFILSSELNINYKEVVKIYNNIFIGLRLTIEDGNANFVQELIEMGKPVIHNGDEEKSIKWNNEEDIIKNIIYYDKIRLIEMDRFMEEEENKINFYNKINIEEREREIIRRNIDIMDEHIKIFEDILIISSDYPSYGGCATNTYNLYKYYKEKKNKRVKIIYFRYKNEKEREEIKDEYGSEEIKFCKKEEIMEKIIEYKIKFDLVIIRNNVDINIKLVNEKCKIYYLIPGVFKNDLDDYYYNIEEEKYLNKNIIKNIFICDKVFCNSIHTIKILEKYVKNIKFYLFYFNFVNYYELLIQNIENIENKENRKYDYGVIVSDYKRKIKNIEGIIGELEKVENKNIIFIGRNINKIDLSRLTKNKIKKRELIKNEKVIDYMKKTKYIMINSFYESCSNVMVDALFNNNIIINTINNTN